jgi:hypothetical protein
MLDMGGAPSAATDRKVMRTVNASKNSKLQAVAFDFEILIRDSESNNKQQASSKPTTLQQESSSSPKLTTRPETDLDQIQQVASLLKVEIHTESKETSDNKPATKPSSPKITTHPHQDVRAKYAKKLKGGLAGIELAKSQIHESMMRGDAAGHLAARKIAIKDAPVQSTRWMANFGASKLLTYLTHRSIRIALLPNPKFIGDVDQQNNEQGLMKELQTQLKDVVIDVIVPGLNSGDAIVSSLQTNVLNEFSMDPHRVLLVSDRDDYLRAGKELGMLVCRLQPKNARRGNVTTHYTSQSVEDVQEVVNEINGISFNTVLNR